MRIGKKYKIGIDLDCVLSDTTQQVVNLYNYYTGENLTLEDITEWDFGKIIPPKYKNLIFDLFFNDKLWQNIKPLKNSEDIMFQLCMERMYDIYIITATYPQNAKVKIDWLMKNYPAIDIKNIIIAHNKQMIDVDLLVDDYEKNLIGGNYSKILLDYPWNRNINDKEHGILRVRNWNEIYKGIKTLLPIG